MSFFADILTSLFERKLTLTRRVEDDNKPIEELCEALLSSRGDVSGMTLAQLILDRYASFDGASKLSWFFLLANDMDVSAETAINAIKDYHAKPSNKAYEIMMGAVEPPRLQLVARVYHVTPFYRWPFPECPKRHGCTSNIRAGATQRIDHGRLSSPERCQLVQNLVLERTRR